MGGEAIKGWLQLHLEDGDSPPRPSTTLTIEAGELVPVRVDPQLAVGLQLRWAREDQGISQGELACRVGVTRQAISQLERPASNITLGVSPPPPQARPVTPSTAAHTTRRAVLLNVPNVISLSQGQALTHAVETLP